WPLTELGQTLDLYQRAKASTRRILDVLDTEGRMVDGNESIADVEGHIVFEKVHFAYGDGPAVLSGIDLEVEPGQTVAVVGSTGAGKTTLVKLLLRFVDPTRGRVLIDRQDISNVKARQLRR